MLQLEPLRPFAREPSLEGIALQAGAQLEAGLLSLLFVLDDPGASLRLPAACSEPQRRDGLWQSTCFEAFLGVSGEPGYWEINLCPSGHWNVYQLEDYRLGLRPEPAVMGLPHHLERSNGHLELRCQLDLRPLIQQDAALELSLTAVLDQTDHGCSYWAWAHTAAEPDFHQRSSFRLIPKRN